MYELLHLLKRIVYLPVVEHFLRRELLGLHRIEYQFEAYCIVRNGQLMGRVWEFLNHKKFNK